MSNSNSSGGGMSLAGVLGVIFIVLKLVGVIDWSWWWVLAPFWIGLALTLVVVLAIALGASAWFLGERWSIRRTAKRMARGLR